MRPAIWNTDALDRLTSIDDKGRFIKIYTRIAAICALFPLYMIKYNKVL